MSKVWLSSKKQRGGSKRYYYLRWIDPVKGWQSEAIKVNGKPCTDRKRAEGERVKREEAFEEGTYRRIQRTTWAAFVDTICDHIAGEAHRTKARYALTKFGNAYGLLPSQVTYANLRAFATKLRNDGLKPASINGVFRYLRLAFNEAERLSIIKTSPMPRRWKWEPEDERAIREISKAEQKALEQAANRLYGKRWRAFVIVALGTGARRGELLALSWGDVDMEAGVVSFKTTKTHKPRTVPVNRLAAAALRSLLSNLEAVRLDGPFKGMADNLGREWGRIRKAAGLPEVKLHDLRRTYISRLIRAGVALPLVSKLAGNGIGVIMGYYNAVGTDDDKREAVARIG